MHAARCPALLTLLGCTALAATGGAGAATHHGAHGHHHQVARATGHHAGKSGKQDAAKPAGVTTVPPSGIRLYCAAGRNPLLIRKFTQGAGTTVTVVCR